MSPDPNGCEDPNGSMPPLVSPDPNGHEDPNGSNDHKISARSSASGVDTHPTHVVYLDSSLHYLLQKREKSTVVEGKNDRAKAKEELERYFLVERGQPEPELEGGVLTKDDGQAQTQEGNDEMHSSTARYCQISMTARTLRDDYGAKARGIDAERDVSTIVDEVKRFLIEGGKAVPEWVRMLSDDTDDDGAEMSTNEQMPPNAGESAGKSAPSGDFVLGFELFSDTVVMSSFHLRVLGEMNPVQPLPGMMINVPVYDRLAYLN